MPAGYEGLRRALVERCAEVDDEVMEHFVSGADVDAAVLIRAVRAGTLSRAFVPAVCGAAYKNRGVQALLDVVVDFLPAPALGDAICRHGSSS
jgi:elongation factor G